MIKVKEEVLINRPVEEVFAFIANPLNIPLWRPDVLETRGTNGTVQVASRFEELVSFMGKKVFPMQVVEYELNRREVIKATGGPGVRPTQSFQLEAKESGTKLNFSVEIETSGLFRLMEPLLPGMIGKKWKGYLVNLKNQLESKY